MSKRNILELMQARKAEEADKHVRDVLQYLITIPEVKEAKKRLLKDQASLHSLWVENEQKDWYSDGSISYTGRKQTKL